MARYAREELGYTGPLVTETQSRSTRENIENAIPLIEAADQIKIVSNFWHTPKARRYLKTNPPLRRGVTEFAPHRSARQHRAVTAAKRVHTLARWPDREDGEEHCFEAFRVRPQRMGRPRV
jgi:hypothetical protein